MELHLGRKLSTDEHVHHIDGNKLNNDIQNLTILSRSDHCRETFKDKEKIREYSINGAIAILKKHGVTLEEVIALYS